MPTAPRCLADLTPQQRADEAKARGLSPFIYGGLAIAAAGGLVGLDKRTRVAVGGIAALFFIAI